MEEICFDMTPSRLPLPLCLSLCARLSPYLLAHVLTHVPTTTCALQGTCRCPVERAPLCSQWRATQAHSSAHPLPCCAPSRRTAQQTAAAMGGARLLCVLCDTCA